MVITAARIIKDFHSVMVKHGQPISVTTYTKTFDDTDYDDSAAYSSGTTVWTSGLVQPQRHTGGESNSQYNSLLQQGLIAMSDKVLYVESGTSFQEDSEDKIVIGLGSPTRSYFSLLPSAVQVPFEIEGKFVYQKVFIRRLLAQQVSGVQL